MDDRISSTKIESPKKNAVLCPVGSMGCSRGDIAFIGAYERKFEKRDVKTKGEVCPKFRSRHLLGASTEF